MSGSGQEMSGSGREMSGSGQEMSGSGREMSGSGREMSGSGWDLSGCVGMHRVRGPKEELRHPTQPRCHTNRLQSRQHILYRGNLCPVSMHYNYSKIKQPEIGAVLH